MLLIVQIALTSAAWRRGWGGRALLPLVVGLGFMFLAGVIGAASGARGPVLFGGLGLLVDLAIAGVLGYMAYSPRRSGAETMLSAASGREQ